MLSVSMRALRSTRRVLRVSEGVSGARFASTTSFEVGAVIPINFMKGECESL
jgi:hypothetical protein